MCFANDAFILLILLIEIINIVLVVCDVQIWFLSSYILLCMLCCDFCHANKLSYLILRVVD